MVIYVVLIIIVLVVIYALVLYNSFIKLNNKVEEAFSIMDVYLKKRWDLVPNLVRVVKGYDKYEKNTLEEVTKLRSSNYDNMSNDEKLKVNLKLSTDISKVIVLVEKYPDLKAKDNFIDLNTKLLKIEDDIVNARKYYNGTVRIFNNKVEMFPNNIFAKVFGFRSKQMFEAKDREREKAKAEL